MTALPWVLVAVLYVLGAVAMVLPAHEVGRLRLYRARYVMAFWPVFIAWALLGTIWEGWTLWRDRHEQV